MWVYKTVLSFDLPTGLPSFSHCSTQPSLPTSALLYPRANGSARKHCPAKHGAGVNPLEQYNTVQTVQCSTDGTTQYRVQYRVKTVQNSAAQYIITVHYSTTVQCSTVQHSTLHKCILQCCTLQSSTVVVQYCNQPQHKKYSSVQFIKYQYTSVQ